MVLALCTNPIAKTVFNVPTTASITVSINTVSGVVTFGRPNGGDPIPPRSLIQFCVHENLDTKDSITGSHINTKMVLSTPDTPAVRRSSLLLFI